MFSWLLWLDAGSGCIEMTLRQKGNDEYEREDLHKPGLATDKHNSIDRQ